MSSLFYPLERRVALIPLIPGIWGHERPNKNDSWLFPVRGLAQRRLARDWLEIYGANENAAGAGDPFFREAVSAHRPAFL
jgi:hypothetical protein